MCMCKEQPAHTGSLRTPDVPLLPDEHPTIVSPWKELDNYLLRTHPVQPTGAQKGFYMPPGASRLCAQVLPSKAEIWWVEAAAWAAGL